MKNKLSLNNLRDGFRPWVKYRLFRFLKTTTIISVSLISAILLCKALGKTAVEMFPQLLSGHLPDGIIIYGLGAFFFMVSLSVFMLIFVYGEKLLEDICSFANKADKKS